MGERRVVRWEEGGCEVGGRRVVVLRNKKVCEVEGDKSSVLQFSTLSIQFGQYVAWHSLSSLGRAVACCTRWLGPPLINGQFSPMICSGRPWYKAVSVSLLQVWYDLVRPPANDRDSPHLCRGSC